jgi:PAS domain S-box-containing protein
VDWNYKYDPQGRVEGFIAVVTDISSRLSATRALEESEQRYRTLFEKAGDAIFILDAQGPDSGRIIDCNQAAAQMHGYTKDEFNKMNIRDLDTPEDAGKADDRIQRMMAGEWIQAEITHRRKDGSEFPLEISAGMVIIGNKKRISSEKPYMTSQPGIGLNPTKTRTRICLKAGGHKFTKQSFNSPTATGGLFY